VESSISAAKDVSGSLVEEDPSTGMADEGMALYCVVSTGLYRPLVPAPGLPAGCDEGMWSGSSSDPVALKRVVEVGRGGSGSSRG